jgi:Rod binding domain-containing protein
VSVKWGARRSTRKGTEKGKTGLASTAKVFRIETEDHKIKERGATWMWHLRGTVGWSSFNQGWFESRAVSSREQGHRVSALGKATSLGFICEKRRMRVGLRSTYPFFLFRLNIAFVVSVALPPSLSYALDASKDPSPQVRDPRVLEAARMYEKYFLGQMVKAMRGTVSYSDLQKPSMGEGIYRDQLDDQYVDSWTNSGGIGLADLIHDELVGKLEMAKLRQEAYRLSKGKARAPLAITDRDILHVRRLPSSGTASAGKETILVSLGTTQKANKEGGEVVRLPWDAALESVQSSEGKVILGLRLASLTAAKVGQNADAKVSSRYLELAFDGAVAKISAGDSLKEGQIVGSLAPSARGILIRQDLAESSPGKPQPARRTFGPSTKVLESNNLTSKQLNTKDSGL